MMISCDFGAFTPPDHLLDLRSVSLDDGFSLAFREAKRIDLSVIYEVSAPYLN
jgi:hypothetical protein